MPGVLVIPRKELVATSCHCELLPLFQGQSNSHTLSFRHSFDRCQVFFYCTFISSLPSLPTHAKQNRHGAQTGSSRIVSVLSLPILHLPIYMRAYHKPGLVLNASNPKMGGYRNLPSDDCISVKVLLVSGKCRFQQG